METFFFLPPLLSPTGGLNVLFSIATHLYSIGYHCTLVFQEICPKLSRITSTIPTVHWNDLKLTSNDFWVVPEGWPMALLPGLKANSHCIVYVQNWAYLHGKLPNNNTWSQLPITMLAVSEPVSLFIKETTGITSQILRPGIDLELFYPAVQDTSVIPKKNPIRIAWMPRKNKALAHQIQHAIQARLAINSPTTIVEWIEIHKKTQDEVATLLRSTQIFLATGFPEGCPLPPLEAFASGCLVVGFGGFGGWDYMRQALPAGYQPQYSLRDVPWKGNGLYVADADVFGATLALEYAIHLVQTNGEKLISIKKEAKKTATAYSLQNHQDTVSQLWEQYYFRQHS